jgi:hypothetical protein
VRRCLGRSFHGFRGRFQLVFHDFRPASDDFLTITGNIILVIVSFLTVRGRVFLVTGDLLSVTRGCLLANANFLTVRGYFPLVITDFLTARSGKVLVTADFLSVTGGSLLAIADCLPVSGDFREVNLGAGMSVAVGEGHGETATGVPWREGEAQAKQSFSPVSRAWLEAERARTHSSAQALDC